MIFTIGTSNRSLDEFVRELQKREITQIVDVRSSPFSRLGHFNSPQITRWAPSMNLLYRKAGSILGGRSGIEVNDHSYRVELDRLMAASSQERIAIFCAEGNPEDCHRSYEIGAALLVNFGTDATNIRRDGTTERVTRTLLETPVSRIPAAIREKALEMADMGTQPRLI